MECNKFYGSRQMSNVSMKSFFFPRSNFSSSNQCIAVNARETAPAQVNITMYKDSPEDSLKGLQQCGRNLLSKCLPTFTQ